MFTLFDLFQVICMFAGAFMGVFTGCVHGGFLGGIVGGFVGFLLGRFVGKFTTDFIFSFEFRKLAKKSTDELRAEVQSGDCSALNLHLVALRSRGEDISNELLIVLDLLEHEDYNNRTKGWAAFTSGYPELVAKVPDYELTDDAEKRRKSLSILRRDDTKDPEL